MKRLFVSICFLVTMSATLAAADQPAVNPRTMKFPELNFQIPKAERVVLDCGMPVYLLRDTELPIINMTAMIRTGSVYEPAAKAGLSGVVGEVMRSGGAGGVAPEAMDDELEFMASAVESGIGSDMGTVSLTALKKNFNRTLQIFGAVLLRPDFSEKRLEIARKHVIEGLRRQNDDPKEIAGREINRAIYAGHPLGEITTFESISSITRQDLVDYHRRFFRLDNMILAVSGDFDRTELLKELNSTFKSEKNRSALTLPEVPQPQQLYQGEVLYGKKDVNQTVIRMGHLGLSKDNPDIYAVRLLDRHRPPFHRQFCSGDRNQGRIDRQSDQSDEENYRRTDERTDQRWGAECGTGIPDQLIHVRLYQSGFDCKPAGQARILQLS